MKQVSFTATEAAKFFPIHRDVGPAYTAPHWVDENADGAPEIQNPTAYRREAKMKLTAELIWDREEELGNGTQVRGNGPGDHDFFGRIGGDAEEGTVAIVGDTITLTDAAAGSFANTIEHFDTFDIDWEISADGGATWVAAGTTKNQVYTLLDNPEGLPKLFHTLAHVSSEAAEGESTEAGLVSKVWGAFAGAQGIQRMDGTTMRYYASWLSEVKTTAAILSSVREDADEDSPEIIAGDGTCDAWVALFLDMLGAHGKREQGNYIVLEPWGNDHENPLYPFRDDGGFIMKEWTFVPEAQATSGDTWYEYKNLFPKTGTAWKNDLILNDNPTSYNWSHEEVSDVAGAGGQGNGDPASLFEHHVLAKVGDRYYDVSMGQDYESVAAWRNDVIVGYWKTVISVEPVNGADHWRIVFRHDTDGNHVKDTPQNYPTE